jgi:hypothetical protein
VQHALQEIQKAILFVRADRNNLQFSGLNWTPVHWFTEFVDLSLAQDLGLELPQRPSRYRQASLPPKQLSIRQRSAKHEDKPTPQKKPKVPAANSQALEVARRL